MALWTETQLLGTELEIVSDHDLTGLLDAIRGHVAVIRGSRDDGRHTLWVERIDWARTGLNDVVCGYVELIESLPARPRALWDGALDRCLNTGIQAGVTPNAYPVNLSAETMARASRIGARHQFTVYAAHSEPPSSEIAGA